ncbi:MAG: hypothetical protein IAE95_01670 [Chitinophagaceae bacterium]|nr:hypothetical protein [Chitinophagaceae bacterium]
MINRKWLPASVQILLVEAVLSIGSDITGLMNPTHTNVVFNIFMLLDTLLLLLASTSLQESNIKYKLKKIYLLTFLFVWVVSVARFGINTFANFAFAVGGLCVTLNYLYTVFLNETANDRKLAIPVRMLSFALIIYHCGTFTFFIALPYLMNESTPEYILDINTWLDSLKYLMIAFSFYLFKSNGQSSKMQAYGK